MKLLFLVDLYLKNQRMSIIDSHSCYLHPSIASYPKHYKLTLLFDFVTITIYKVTISGYLILVWFVTLLWISFVSWLMVMNGRVFITLIKPRVSKNKYLTCHILSLQTIVDINCLCRFFIWFILHYYGFHV